MNLHRENPFEGFSGCVKERDHGLFRSPRGQNHHSLPQVPPDESLRTELEQYDIEELIARLAQLGPLPGEGVLQSKRRVIRALEVALYKQDHPVEETSYLPKKPYYIGTLVSREERNARIDARLDARLQEGLIE